MQKLSKSNYIKNGYLSAAKKAENTFIQTHFHDFYELELIVSGDGTYTVDGTEYKIEPGCLFFLTPLDFHHVNIKNAELYNVMFLGNICDQATLQSLTKNSPIFLKTSGKSRLLLENLLTELCENIDDKNFSEMLLNTILAKLEKEIVSNESVRELSAINKAELYILNNFRSNLKLEDVANEVAFAPTYFSRIFKAKKGQSFKNYLNTMRFEYAKKLLEHTEMTVMQVCNECGFNDYPNFIRRFKQHTTYYPAEYRRLYK
ncbi:MAG: helix-turn-helix domain-containing protein [Oscillospiraceae bacterium]|nr:helix-turn-helix domain-containing protein [Oscillospiraceae bacterium]